MKFSHIMWIYNIWFLSSSLLCPSFSSLDSTLTTSNLPKILIQTNHIVSSLSSTLFAHLSLLPLNASKSPWNGSKTSQKSLVSLARVTMYYLGILGIITTQKVWNSWELVSKMCGFWVIINSLWDHIDIGVHNSTLKGSLFS